MPLACATAFYYYADVSSNVNDLMVMTSSHPGLRVPGIVYWSVKYLTWTLTGTTVTVTPQQYI